MFQLIIDNKEKKETEFRYNDLRIICTYFMSGGKLYTNFKITNPEYYTFSSMNIKIIYDNKIYSINGLLSFNFDKLISNYEPKLILFYIDQLVKNYISNKFVEHLFKSQTKNSLVPQEQDISLLMDTEKVNRELNDALNSINEGRQNIKEKEELSNELLSQIHKIKLNNQELVERREKLQLEKIELDQSIIETENSLKEFVFIDSLMNYDNQISLFDNFDIETLLSIQQNILSLQKRLILAVREGK